jgi:hypothetical protein
MKESRSLIIIRLMPTILVVDLIFMLTLFIQIKFPSAFARERVPVKLYICQQYEEVNNPLIDASEQGENLSDIMQLTVSRDDIVLAHYDPLCTWTEPLLVDTVTSGQQVDLDFTITLPGREMGNSYQGEKMNSRFSFNTMAQLNNGVYIHIPVKFYKTPLFNTLNLNPGDKITSRLSIVIGNIPSTPGGSGNGDKPKPPIPPDDGDGGKPPEDNNTPDTPDDTVPGDGNGTVPKPPKTYDDSPYYLFLSLVIISSALLIAQLVVVLVKRKNA